MHGHSAQNFAYSFREGTVVCFRQPYATVGTETNQTQYGVVLSRKEYNNSNAQICVCPIVPGRNSINELLGILLSSSSESPLYLRPDLSTYIGITYGSVTPVISQGKIHRVTDDITAQAVDKLLGMLEPNPEKLGTRGKGFLAYGQIGWFTDVPYVDEPGRSKAPVLCLTPPEIYSLTGRATVIRAHSNTLHTAPQWNVDITQQKWLKDCRFPASCFQCLSIMRQDRNNRDRPFSLGMSEMKGAYHKAKGAFDQDEFDDNVGRYVKGVPAAQIVAARQARAAQRTDERAGPP